MKAEEVLRRYSAGERNFRSVNLRGASFKGQDLSTADFSGADIRSANFTNATLHDVNFTKVQAGSQRRWMVIQLLATFIWAVIAGVIQGIAGAIASALFDGSREGAIVGCVYLFMIVADYVSIFLQGFTIRAFGTILIAVALIGSAASAIAGSDAMAGATAGVIAIAFAFAVGGAFAVAATVAFAAAVGGTAIAGGTCAVITVVAIICASAVPGTVSAAVASVVVVLLLSFYVGLQVLKENDKFAVVRLFGLGLATWQGTTFCGADLTGANLSQARLKSTNFDSSRQHHTNLTHVCWQGAKRIRHARLGNAILQDKRIRDLLTTAERGYKQDFTDADLRGANLRGVTLEGATLKRAILNDALLEKAVLKDAILTEAQAINTDFTDACLTGATLEAWNIDSTTTFQNIDCQYVFLREHSDARGNRERRPHNPDKVFQPGDFEKFFKEMLDEVQILIRNGIDPAAFRTAFQNIMEQNPDVTQDAIKSIEKQGEDILLTLEVRETTDKAKIERDWDAGYQAGLKAGKTAERLASGQKFEQIAFALADKPINVESRSEVKMGNDYSQNIDVKGDFTVTANQSVVSLRDISGQVNNQIAQLSDEPVQAQLKDLLGQLQTAIGAESELSEETKTEALEEVKALAAAGQAPQEGPMKKAAKRAITVLKGMTVGLGETTKFVEACKGLLPAIALLFGL